MKDQDKINLIAPCGINCSICRAYLGERNPCPGCRADDAGKRKARVMCKMKTCGVFQDTEKEYCYQCLDFPCKRILNLDKRYRNRYQMSLVENLEDIRDLGLENFLNNEDTKWTCKNCGGTICVHDGLCYKCGKTKDYGGNYVAKLDLKKLEKRLYSPSTLKVSLVDVPKMNYLMIDGKGDPNTSTEYQDAMETLFPVSFKVKFISKKEKNQDYVVMPMEGLWWVPEMEDFSIEDKSSWNWTAMIRQPDFITQSMIDQAISEVKQKKNPPSLAKIRFESLLEGLSAQIMHIGPYSEEGPTVEKLHSCIREKGFYFNGVLPGQKHHEIYLSDMRRTKPERLKTIIRQPVNE
jgi:hypothetical protein